MNNNGEKQEIQVLLDFTLFLVLLLFCVFSRCEAKYGKSGRTTPATSTV
jgi:hypothetical protein